MWTYILPRRVTRSWWSYQFLCTFSRQENGSIKYIGKCIIYKQNTVHNKKNMHEIQRPPKEHYTSATSFRCAVECDEIEWFIYQVPVPICEQFSAIVIMYYSRRWFRALLISFLSFSRCFFVKTRVCVLCFIPLTSFFSSALQIVELFVIILLPNIYSISEYFSFLLSPRDNMSAFSWLTDAITVEQNRPCQT